MSKLQLVAPPLVEKDASGEFTLTIADAEDGHGAQIFKASDLDSLCTKLGTSAQHATAHIRDLTRELRELRRDYAITRDVASLLTALLVVKHSSGDAPTRALDKIVRSMARDVSARLPEAESKKETTD